MCRAKAPCCQLRGTCRGGAVYSCKTPCKHTKISAVSQSFVKVQWLRPTIAVHECVKPRLQRRARHTCFLIENGNAKGRGNGAHQGNKQPVHAHTQTHHRDRSMSGGCGLWWDLGHGRTLRKPVALLGAVATTSAVPFSSSPTAAAPLVAPGTILE